MFLQNSVEAELPQEFRCESPNLRVYNVHLIPSMDLVNSYCVGDIILSSELQATVYWTYHGAREIINTISFCLSSNPREAGISISLYK